MAVNPSTTQDSKTLKKIRGAGIFITGAHLVCLLVFVVGWSQVAIGVALGFYFLRMFALTAFYHRYFSHRSFKTSRVVQFVFAFIGMTAAENGILWWAANHRHHHQYSDREEDIHSPRQMGLFNAHIGWVPVGQVQPTKMELIPDFAKYPELVWFEKHTLFPPLLSVFMMYVVGSYLQVYYPEMGTTGGQMIIWGYFISTIALWHVTLGVNSLGHYWGKQPYDTGDDSRNNWILALLTLGDGWHNNHHFYATSVRHGFKWYEIDITYYILWLMSKVGLVWDLKYMPEKYTQS